MLDLFYFNLCFPLLLVTKRMLFIHNVHWETLPLCLNIKPKCLFIRPCPPVDDHRKEEINTFLLQGLPFPEIFARLMDFLLWFFISSTTLFYKKPGIQTQIRRLFWGVSLPSSPSADFLNKVFFLASTLHLQFIGLSCSEQCKLGLGNKFTSWVFLSILTSLLCVFHLRIIKYLFIFVQALTHVLW